MIHLSNMDAIKNFVILCIHLSSYVSSVIEWLQELVKNITVIYWPYVKIFRNKICLNCCPMSSWPRAAINVGKYGPDGCVSKAKQSSVAHHIGASTIAEWQHAWFSAAMELGFHYSPSSKVIQKDAVKKTSTQSHRVEFMVSVCQKDWMNERILSKGMQYIGNLMWLAIKHFFYYYTNFHATNKKGF